MHALTLLLHSWIRWAVILLAVIAVARALSGWLGGNRWREADDRVGRLFVVALDVQALLGLLLYVILSPITTSAFQNMAAAMTNSVARFWVVEHLTAMVAALALAHVGRARLRRASRDAAKQRLAAIFFTLVLVLILAAMPWPGLGYGRPLFRVG